MAGKPFVFRFDDVEVREREFMLVKAGQVLAIEPKAFRALLFLLRNPPLPRWATGLSARLRFRKILRETPSLPKSQRI